MLLAVLACNPAVGRDAETSEKLLLTPCAAPDLATDTAQAANTLRGRVCLEKTGEPLPNVSVAITIHEGELRTTTDSTGSYVLTGIPLGDFTVRARAIGYYPEDRMIVFGGCGLMFEDSAGRARAVRIHDPNPFTCRAEQWLAFYLRPRPIY